MQELICIVCPKGCIMTMEEGKDCAPGQIMGYTCPKGEEYARQELSCPTRVVTSTVKIIGAAHPRLPVKTDGSIPKDRIFDCIRLMDSLSVQAPVQLGQCLIADALGLGVSVVACRTMDIADSREE